MIEERSDVREFKNQMQEMHGLLGHAAGGVPLVAEGDDAIVSATPMFAVMIEIKCDKGQMSSLYSTIKSQRPDFTC